VNTKNFGSIAGKNTNPGKPIQDKFHSSVKAKVQATTKYVWHQNYKYNSLANPQQILSQKLDQLPWKSCPKSVVQMACPPQKSCTFFAVKSVLYELLQHIKCTGNHLGLRAKQLPQFLCPSLLLYGLYGSVQYNQQAINCNNKTNFPSTNSWEMCPHLAWERFQNNVALSCSAQVLSWKSLLELMSSSLP